MQWDDYKLILTIARSKKLSVAADQIGVTISTMFRKLDRIEDHLKSPVFLRERGVYIPNEVGKELCLAAERMEQEAAQASLKIQGKKNSLVGEVTITASEALAPFFLARHSESLAKKYPDLKLNLMSGNDVLSLSNRDADVALRPVRPNDESLFGRKLSDIRWAVYGDLETKKRLGSSPDVAGERFVGFNGNPFAERAMASQISKFPRAQVQTLTNSLLLTASAAANGSGIALLPMILGEQWPGLCRITAPLEHEFGELWVVCHKDMSHNLRIRVVFDALIAGAKSDQMLFIGGV